MVESDVGAPVGARWVAGLGAFLLVAAAATFVAVRWEQIPDSAKLAALVAVTGICLVAHRRLRATLLVTAAAVFHLGVLLVPIDVAAIGVQGGWAWPRMLLAQGLTAAVTFGVAAHIERSVVLRMAAWAGVVALAGGIGAATALPAGLVLATAAAAAAANRSATGLDMDRAATGWATLAGLAVPLAGAERLGWPAAGVLTDLGLAGEPPHVVAAVTGLLAGVVLGVVAHRHRNLPIALVGVASTLVGTTTAFVSFDPSPSASLTAVAALCLLAEAAAWTWRRDPFWAQPTAIMANVGEVAAGVITVGLAAVVLVAPMEPSTSPLAGLAAGLVALGWIGATARRPVRRGPNRWGSYDLAETWRAGAPFAAAVAASAAITLVTGSGVATALALTVCGIALVIGPAVGALPTPPSGQVLAAGLLGWAPIAAYDNRVVAGTVGVLGAVALTEAAVQRTRTGTDHRTTVSATLLSLLALVPLAAAALVVASSAAEHGFATALGVTVCAWLLAAQLDRATSMVPLALIPRVAALVPLLYAAELEPNQAALLGAVVAALALIDAMRLSEPLLAVGAGFGVPVATVGMAVASGWTIAEAGLGVTLTGIAWLGLSGTLSDRWVPPAVISAAGAAGAGLLLSTGDTTAFSTNLLLVGATMAALGAAIGQSPLVVSGLAVGTIGVWGHLAQAEITASEPYLVPVALLLLVAGVPAYREHDVSSWLAFAPAVALLGGAGLVERLAGGPGWHGLVAGAVGATAVAAGGVWRLAGPLLVGTALVAATTVHETVGVTASLDTWVWLAIGGISLLAAGVAMERRGLGPYETGRRLVDLVRERFA